MDFEQDNNLTEGIEPQPVTKKPKKRTGWPRPSERRGWRIFWGIILAMSVLANIVLFMMLIGMAVIFTAGRRDIFAEEVIREGPRTAKIAVISVQGIIDDEQAKDVQSQIKKARKDRSVKGLIVRIDSPGGTISGSDGIWNDIRKYRQQENKPVVAFMQGVAASGGYYTSVACDKIVAEPTVITGSIGVIAGHFVVQELFEAKLGIKPAIIKSGEKKDWPSLFSPFTEEQRKYVEDKLITPSYERFVQIVAEGRGALSITDVKRLADGSIYGAQEALDEKLIDRIGYLDEAIEEVKSLAGIEKAQVLEYKKPFSFADFLSVRSENILKFDKKTLYELSTLQVLYLWSL